jgi:hypothetical protein
VCVCMLVRQVILYMHQHVHYVLAYKYVYENLFEMKKIHGKHKMKRKTQNGKELKYKN